MLVDTGFKWPDIVEDCIARAGGSSATGEDVLNLTRSLRILMEDWQAKGFPTWRIRTVTKTVIAPSTSIRLPDCIDDIIAVASRVDTTAKGRDGPMERIGPDEYHRLASKRSTGRPSQWYLQRSTCPELFVFPVGYKDRPTYLDIMYVERPAAFAAFDPTDDIPGRWLKALVMGLAHDLACKRPVKGGEYNEGLIQRLQMQADAATEAAQRADRQRTVFKVRF
jgi:hypothetical protein